MKKLIEKAQKLAREAHWGQTDRAGQDYYGGHLLTVASLVDTEEEKAVALLHDILEDTFYSESDMFDAGIPLPVVLAVQSMTKKKGEWYWDYLERVKGNELSRAVKIADICHNMGLDRLPTYGACDIQRVNKYKKALGYLLS